MMRKAFVAAMLLSTGAVGLAVGEERYSLERTEDGYVRMDNGSGAMSLCTESAGQLVCRLAADDRVALEDEIARLQERIDALDKRLAALEGKSPAFELPDGEDLDRTMNTMERFFRRFMDMIRDMERDGTGAGEKT